MAEPKQRRTSRSELLARPQCLKATGDLRCFHRHAVLPLFNARNPAFTALARCQRDRRNLPIAHAALSSPKIRLGKEGEIICPLWVMMAEIDHPDTNLILGDVSRSSCKSNIMVRETWKKVFFQVSGSALLSSSDPHGNFR